MRSWGIFSDWWCPNNAPTCVFEIVDSDFNVIIKTFFLHYGTPNIQGFENIAYEREPPPENTYKSKLNDQKLSNVIQTIDFIEQYKDMVSYEDMEREFNDIKSAFRAETGGACQLAENRGKNRYMNIMPNDITRVKLSNQTNDYINANYISIKDESEYIATQGPLPGTKEDFWNMVWNENSRTIIMLTQLVEGGRIKCDQYWPFDDKSGDCQVLPNNPKIGQLKIMPKNPTKPHFNSVFSSKPKTVVDYLSMIRVNRFTTQ